MATQENATPKADQPRVTAGSLKKDTTPTLQYRVSNIKTYGRPMGSRSSRDTGRG